MEFNFHATGGRDAAAIKSGQPVSHSGPVAMQPTSPEARAESPLPAHQDSPQAQPSPKSGQGFGGSAPERFDRAEGASTGGAGAEPPPFLDPLRNNCKRPAGRKPNCGRWSLKREAPNEPPRFTRLDCKTWGCGYCGPKKARRARAAIRDAALRHRLHRLLTLTLDPARIQGEPVPYLRQTFAKLRIYLGNRYGRAISYIAILEFQQNGSPHLHILVDRYIPQPWIASAWQAVGGGRMVDIRYVDLHRVSRYLAKYLTKELLMSAPARSRRVTTSQSIRLFKKRPPDGTWRLLRRSIFLIFDLERERVRFYQCDEEGILRGLTLAAEGE
jgi:hypothetical protein